MLGSLWLLYSLSFLLLKFFPGSPFDSETQLQESVQAQLSKVYGLNLPWHEQYWFYLKNILTGHWGVSQFFENRSVEQIILRSFQNTGLLVLGAISLALIVSVAFAVDAQKSVRSRQRFEWISLGLLSTPTLFIAPVLILVFGLWLKLLPVALLDYPSSYILPVLVLSLKPMAGFSRMLEVQLRQDFLTDDIRFLRSMGVSESKLLWKYALKKSSGPLISFAGQLLASMLAGATMVEVIFAIPGLGTQFFEAVLNRDCTVVLGLTLFLGFNILVAQFLIEVALRWIDPRKRESI